MDQKSQNINKKVKMDQKCQSINKKEWLDMIKNIQKRPRQEFKKIEQIKNVQTPTKNE